MVSIAPVHISIKDKFSIDPCILVLWYTGIVSRMNSSTERLGLMKRAVAPTLIYIGAFNTERDNIIHIYIHAKYLSLAVL